jgi:hypothetical protein
MYCTDNRITPIIRRSVRSLIVHVTIPQENRCDLPTPCPRSCAHPACTAGSATLAQDCRPQADPDHRGFPAGGTTDILARARAKLAEPLGQSAWSQGGAGSIIRTDAVAKAAPGSYTFLLGNSGRLASG